MAYSNYAGSWNLSFLHFDVFWMCTKDELLLERIYNGVVVGTIDAPAVSIPPLCIYTIIDGPTVYMSDIFRVLKYRSHPYCVCLITIMLFTFLLDTFRAQAHCSMFYYVRYDIFRVLKHCSLSHYVCMIYWRLFTSLLWLSNILRALT